MSVHAETEQDAMAAGADGILIEVHYNPSEAMCDKEHLKRLNYALSLLLAIEQKRHEKDEDPLIKMSIMGHLRSLGEMLRN